LLYLHCILSGGGPCDACPVLVLLPHNHFIAFQSPSHDSTFLAASMTCMKSPSVGDSLRTM
jgi:hypothetical protein